MIVTDHCNQRHFLSLSFLFTAVHRQVVQRSPRVPPAGPEEGGQGQGGSQNFSPEGSQHKGDREEVKNLFDLILISKMKRGFLLVVSSVLQNLIMTKFDSRCVSHQRTF